MSYRSARVAVRLAASVAFAIACALVVPGCGSAAGVTWNVLNNPIDPGQLTKMQFGRSSFWLQPWRSSLETQPATLLQNAIGINTDNLLSAKEFPATARLLHDSGFRRARLEISPNQLRYDDPSQFINPAHWVTLISALRNNGLRPLILLNSDPRGPEPMVGLTLNLTAPAARGATTISLDAASAAQVVPGLTGINEPGFAAKVLITAVGLGNVATLSQPLPAGLGAGPVAAATLRYPPWAPPYLASGAPNPRFDQTLAGWLAYVKTVTQFVRDVYGSDNFDVEVWNENTGFLKQANYYSPLPDPGATGPKSTVGYAILQATIAMLRDPANGLTDVKVGDGFSNTSPWTSGTLVPPGTNAIDKHPYQSVRTYPGYPAPPGILRLDAQGTSASAHSHGPAQQSFTPSFRAYFPEYYLSGIQTETLMRDLSPIQTSIYGVPHGAGTHPDGTPPPAMWITEVNLDSDWATGYGMPAADVPEMQAKAALRYFVSYASEGAQAIDLFAAKGGPGLHLIPPAFFSAVDANPGSYPANLGGRTMQAVGRLASTLSGAQPIASPRQLTLGAIAQYGNDSQFTGNGTTAFPNLYNRDVLAFFPFQLSQNSFVAPVYVMTRDLAHRYTSNPAPGQTPYDLPAEKYLLDIGNVNAADATVSLYDPLTGTQEPATIVSRKGSEIVVALTATDSPRMLTITDGRSGSTGGATLTLRAPRKISAATARRRGIKLVIGCAAACSVQITASPVRHGRRAPVYRRIVAYATAANSGHITLRLNSRGRAWLRTRKSARLRITARDSLGTAVSKIIQITHGRAHGPCRKHRRRVACGTSRA